MMKEIDISSFEKLRGRTVFTRAIFSVIVSIILVLLIFPEWTEENSESRFPEALLGVLLYGFFLLFIWGPLSRASLSYSRLFGTFPTWTTLRRYSLWAVPLVVLSIASIYSLYFPLSFLLPGIFEWWFLENSPTTMVLTSGDKYVIVNLLNFFTIVIVAPIIEEFFFRGILLTRWTIKWGVRSSILASSIAFAILHTDLIGSFCFGCVMAIFYIRTKSLFIPICVHIANNGIAWILGCVEARLDEPASTLQQEIAHFQEFWWIGLFGIVIIIPCAIHFRKHYILNTDWHVPYLAEPINSENRTNDNGL